MGLRRVGGGLERWSRRAVAASSFAGAHATRVCGLRSRGSSTLAGARPTPRGSTPHQRIPQRGALPRPRELERGMVTAARGGGGTIRRGIAGHAHEGVGGAARRRGIRCGGGGGEEQEGWTRERLWVSVLAVARGEGAGGPICRSAEARPEKP